MKKVISVILIVLTIFSLAACETDPTATSIAPGNTKYFVALDESLTIDYTVKDTTGVELAGKAASLKVKNGTADAVEINGTSIKITQPGTYGFQLVLDENSSVASDFTVYAYKTEDIEAGVTKDFTDSAVVTNFKATAPQSAELGDDADSQEIYDFLAARKSAKMAFDVAMDFTPFVELTEDTATLDITTYTLFKIKKDGEPLNDFSKTAIFGHDEASGIVFQLLGNNYNLAAVESAGYQARWGTASGIRTYYPLTRAQYDMAVENNPDLLKYSNNLEFLLFAEDAGNYEITCEVVKKDLSEVLFSKTKLFRIA